MLNRFAYNFHVLLSNYNVLHKQIGIANLFYFPVCRVTSKIEAENFVSSVIQRSIKKFSRALKFSFRKSIISDVSLHLIRCNYEKAFKSLFNMSRSFPLDNFLVKQTLNLTLLLSSECKRIKRKRKTLRKFLLQDKLAKKKLIEFLSVASFLSKFQYLMFRILSSSPDVISAGFS